MKIAVIYKSAYGATKQYAQWLSESLNAEIYERSKAKIEDLKKYDIIIYGGGLYAGSVSGIELIAKNFEKLKDKKLIVFTVGIANPEASNNSHHIMEGIKKSYPKLAENAKFFHLRGGMDYSKMSFIHKSMMGMMIKILKNKPVNEQTEDDKVLIESYNNQANFIAKIQIEPIIELANNLKGI